MLCGLPSGAQNIIKQVAEMRTAAQAEMVLDESSEPEVVISYLSDLLQRAQTEQTEQERIVYHQSFLNIPKMVNDDLALAKEEVSCLVLVQLLCLAAWAWRHVILGGPASFAHC